MLVKPRLPCPCDCATMLVCSPLCCWDRQWSFQGTTLPLCCSRSFMILKLMPFKHCYTHLTFTCQKYKMEAREKLEIQRMKCTSLRSALILRKQLANGRELILLRGGGDCRYSVEFPTYNPGFPSPLVQATVTEEQLHLLDRL